MTATHWESLGDMVSSPGVFTEVIHLYLATGLEEAAAKPEEHEVLEVHWKPLEEAVEMARNGSGMRDTARVLCISPTTVIAIVRKSRRAGGEVATEVRVIPIETASSYRLELDNLADAALGRAPLLLGRDDAVGQARTIEALYRSAAERRVAEVG